MDNGRMREGGTVDPLWPLLSSHIHEVESTTPHSLHRRTTDIYHGQDRQQTSILYRTDNRQHTVENS